MLFKDDFFYKLLGCRVCPHGLSREQAEQGQVGHGEQPDHPQAD